LSPDTRKHRGAHPEDRRLFAPERVPALRAATAELSWLLSHGYPPKGSLKLVGDRHALEERQRAAVGRAACSDERRDARRARCLPPAQIEGREILVDGFNLIIGLEVALSGGVLFRCRDGCTRDLASLHGTYRTVEETETAVRLAGQALAALRPASVTWLLDSPVSNSGRLAARMAAIAADEGWPWTVEAVFNPDPLLAAAERIVATSDSAVLDRAGCWTDLATHVVTAHVPGAWILPLGD
jgi:hypothetical protein